MQKWQEITGNLYRQIKPTGGKIYSRYSNSLHKRNIIDEAWVEFEMNEFKYIDPFYGEQNSTSNFRMNFSLSDFLADLFLESVLQIENYTFIGDKEDSFGSFSNSLDFTIPKMNFGKLQDDKSIECDMTYSLTNSESYPFMNGTIKEHIQLSGQIRTKLIFKDLLITIHKNSDLNDVLANISPKYYDTKNIYEAKDLNSSKADYFSFYIPYLK